MGSALWGVDTIYLPKVIKVHLRFSRAPKQIFKQLL